MNTPTCETCIYFHQHYVMTDQYSVKAYCGHCVRPRCKHRRPDAKICNLYEARSAPPSLPDRSSTIHYLTTKVLEYVLNLPLPPEIK